jgi:MoaA/NifB/PqqE/SkfB family radical SAM enzyme
MPSTIGLGHAGAIGRRTDYLPSNGLRRTEIGDLVVPAALLAQSGLGAGDDLICEAKPDGLRLAPDALRKVYVEITSQCNLSCATCIRQAWDEPLGHMALARFSRLLDGLPGAEGQRSGGVSHPITLSLSGFGEPLVHPEFLTFIRLARKRGVRVEIITNGTLLDAALARELVALGISQVTVSLDGGDEVAYAAVRGQARAPAVAAVAALVEARRRARRGLAIGLAFVATRRNIGSLPGLLALAHDLQLDFASVSNVAPHTPEMAAEMLWGGAAWAASFPDASWRPRLELARMTLDEQSRPALAALLDHGPTWPHPGAVGGPQRNHCRFAHEGVLAVAWDGRVAPCLSLLHTHLEYVNGHWKTVHRHVVGHVAERPLLDIWRDVAYRDFRQRLRTFDFPACFACGGCPETDTNDTDCYGGPFPSCSECLWAQGIVLCP